MALQPNGRGPGEELYVPTITATTTDPDLGAGATIEGGWQPVGSLVWWWAHVILGTDPDPGSGYWIISLPKAPVSDPNRIVGDGSIVDASAEATGQFRPVRVACAAALATALSVDEASAFLFDASGPSAVLTALIADDAPFVWAAGDSITVSGLYQPA